MQSRMSAQLRRVHDVEDVVQETLLRAFRSIDRFQWQGEESFLRWLGGIGRHVVLKLASRYEREQVLSLEQDPVRHGTSPSKAVRRDERFERLEKSLAGLSPDHREVIFLARIEGLRVKDIAERMNRTPDATAHLLARALRALKRSFGDTESLRLPRRALRRAETPGDDGVPEDQAASEDRRASDDDGEGQP